MKKKLLFIAPDYYGFNEAVHDGLKSYSGCEVIEINSTETYRYKNVIERIYNLFLKTFTNKNLKLIKKGQHIRQIIQKHDYYDLLLVNRPDVLSEQDLDLAISKSKKSKVIFWDSIDKIPQQFHFIGKFSEILSFDPEDCQRYNLKPITNFYFKEVESKNIRYDVALLMSYDARINDAIKIFEHFKRVGIRAKAKIFTYRSHPIKEKLPDNMEVIHKIIPFKDAWKYYLDSAAILDISHQNQSGLSFRPFEAIGLKKKLITTADIRSLDFFNTSNFFYINDVLNISLTKSFFDSNYIEYNEDIKKKYYIKNWVNSVIQ